MLTLAGQRLTVEQAVPANTLGAAYRIRLDALVGSLETGKIHGATVTLTMMNGQIRHQV